VAVAGFGAGAIVLATVAEAMLEAGFSVLAIFGWIGLVYGGVIVLSGLVMRFPIRPPKHCRRSGPPVMRVAGDAYFWALFVGIFCGTFAGLIIIGNLDPLAQANGISPRMAVLAISTFAVGNGIGRIVWGRITDHLARRTIVPSLLTLAVAIALLLPAAFNPYVFVLASCLVGFGFGACFVVYAALTANRYGAHHVGNIYPLIFLGYGVAGISGPMLAGWLRDATGGYGASALLTVAVLAAGMVVSALLLRAAKDTPPTLDAAPVED
jgi:OFA family oxalate/formate antiporter-like MFS transporter